ncbi:hypothetical protein GQ44DRAFT_716847 [Phaeosphaeriaceae sp. PMI808]|nr:hypothetical protein GQ44DRAFT_716847 [Phaeosphaeriaceae sp. PMI808]
MAASYMHCNNHIFWHADLTCTYIPPKTTRAAQRRFGVRNGLEEREVKRVDSGNLGKPQGQEVVTKIPKLQPGFKLARIGDTPKTTMKASSVQVLKFLLSDASLEFCLPRDEVTEINEHDAKFITYSQLRSPFEELLCAVVLSRPIPHRQGLCMIRTMLNAPYSFHNPVAIKTAGRKKILEALEIACAQHNGATTEEIQLILEALMKNNWHNNLPKLRSQTRNSVESEREVLRRTVKGLGRTGLDIFYRRIQWQWHEASPFIDPRTQASLEKLGLPRRAEGIAKMIEVRWAELKLEEGSEYNEEIKRRRAFVMLLERALGADLENNVEVVLMRASGL